MRVGERGGELLPLLLKPGSLTKMPKAERDKLRRRAGVDSFADMARPLQPRTAFLAISPTFPLSRAC